MSTSTVENDAVADGHWHGSAHERKGFFTDTSICIGCKACEVACKEWNNNPQDGTFELLGSSYDNTGSLGANTGVILRRVVLPEIAPAISAAGALTFLLTLNEIGIVLVTGAKSVETLPMLVYKRAIESADFPGAAVVACVEVVVSVCVYVAYRRLFRGAH